MNKLRTAALLLAFVMTAAVSAGCADKDSKSGSSGSSSSAASEKDGSSEEDTTKRTRSNDEEDATGAEPVEETSEETTAEETAEATAAAPAVQSESCLIDDADIFSDTQADELNEYIRGTADELDMNICVYIAGSADIDLTDEETEESACARYDEMFGADTDGVLLYLDMSEGEVAYDYIVTSGRAEGMYENKFGFIFAGMNEYLPVSGEEIVPDEIFTAVQAFCDQLVNWSDGVVQSEDGQ